MRTCGATRVDRYRMPRCVFVNRLRHSCDSARSSDRQMSRALRAMANQGVARGNAELKKRCLEQEDARRVPAGAAVETRVGRSTRCHLAGVT